MIKKTISVDFWWGNEVALKTESEVKRIVTGIILRPSGKMYELANGLESTWHQGIEIEKYPETLKVRGFSKNPLK